MKRSLASKVWAMSVCLAAAAAACGAKRADGGLSGSAPTAAAATGVGAVPDSAAARKGVSALVSALAGRPADAALLPGLADGFRDGADGLRAQFAARAKPGQALVTFPERANTPVRIVDLVSGAGVAFAPAGARNVAAEVADGYLVYRGGQA